MKKNFGISFLVIILSAMPLCAQTGIWLGPQVGLYTVRDVNETHVMPELAMRLKFSDAFGIEATAGYRREYYADDFVSVKSWPVMVSGMLYPVPFIYGTIGAGWYNSRIEYSVPAGYLGGTATFSGDTKQEFGWHFGGGLELTPLTSMKLVADVKYVYLDYAFRDFPGSNNVNSNFTIVSFGMLFAL